MLGAIIGDIVGSRFEWNNNRSKEFDFLTYKCFPTDDSIMSLAIAQAILVSITLKFCTFFTLKKCTDITVFSLRVIHLFPLVDNFHQQSLLLWNDEGFYQVLPLIWYYLGICPAILRSFCLL